MCYIQLLKARFNLELEFAMLVGLRVTTGTASTTCSRNSLKARFQLEFAMLNISFKMPA